MITKNYTWEYDLQEFKEYRLLIVSDQHYGHADADLKKYRRILSNNLKDQPNVKMVTIGDNMDCITTRDKRFEMVSVAPQYLSIFEAGKDRRDELIDLQLEDFIADHEPYKQSIIGIGVGNHENDIKKYHNTNVVRRACNALGVQNLGYSCIVQIAFRPKGKNRSSRIFKYMQHHGAGGENRTEGGPLTTYADYAKNWRVDAFFGGHKHDFVYKRVGVGDVDRNARLEIEPMIVGLTGTFLRTFNTSDNASWPERMMFKPKFLMGGYLLRFMPDRTGAIEVKVMEA